MSIILDLQAREILDSRGNPTVEVDILLESGIKAQASVPSGASTGSHEAMEKRDSDEKRYLGKGVLGAIDTLHLDIAPAIIGLDAHEQFDLDKLLIDLDGTENKSNLGANATLGVSLAVAKAAAQERDLPLFQYLGGIQAKQLPMPLMNVINGGAHADTPLGIQEIMIVPTGAETFSEALRIGAEVFHHLKRELQAKGHRTNVGDEGGFAPDLQNTQEALDFLLRAIEKAGYVPGDDVGIALDVAANEIASGSEYHLASDHISGRYDALIPFYERLIRMYPIVSIEDALSENDYDGWIALTETLGHKIQIVGDDLFVTHAQRLQEGIAKSMANSILIKPNQIGTLSETLHTIHVAKKANYKCVLSHRSGETEDTTIADLAVATNCGQIKTGSLCRTDRIAKYNQLLRIEEALGGQGTFDNPFITR